MKIENFIALRYLRENRKNREISSSSYIVIIAVAIAIVFYISSVSIMNGYIQGRMQIQFELTSFHINYFDIEKESDAIDIVTKINKNELVRNCYQYRESKVVLSANGVNSGLLYFRAIPENIFEEDEGLQNQVRIVEGKRAIQKNEILLSKRSAEKLKVKPGDYIYMTAMMTKEGAQVRFKRLLVTGVFSTGFVELDEQLAFVTLDTGKEIFDSGVKYSIAVKIKDYKNATVFARANRFSSIAYQSTWIEENFNELTALNFEKNVIAFIVIIVIVVAVLNILTTIHITVMEKKQDIGVLKAIGYSPRNIIMIFLLNGYYIGFVGVIVGVILGLLTMSWLDNIMLSLGNIIDIYFNIIYKILSPFVSISVPEKIEIFSKDFYLDKIYTNISYIEVLLVSFITLHFSIAASIIPAIKAGGIKPNEVIKNG